MTSNSDKYDADYFLRGKASGKSLYDNYRWMPDLTKPMAERIIEHLGIELDDRIMDFGCARGYLVRALTELGQDAYGLTGLFQKM
jgi:cyclopropane fatty-acyl-phospholipid synthase-like methyltransferase